MRKLKTTRTRDFREKNKLQPFCCCTLIFKCSRPCSKLHTKKQQQSSTTSAIPINEIHLSIQVVPHFVVDVAVDALNYSTPSMNEIIFSKCLYELR